MSGSGWTVVEKKKVEKPKLHMVQIPRDDWTWEFTETDRRIFLLLSSVFPKGLTAEDIANRLNKQPVPEGGEAWPVLSAGDIGDLFYGDKQDVSDELVPFVVPVNPNHRPKRWRVRAESDP